MNKTLKQDKDDFRKRIRALAGKALKKLPAGSVAFKESKLRRNKPMDYLRCVEFPLAKRQLSLSPGMSVLDVASPQWFSLTLAHHNPEVRFFYTNILQSELDQVRETAECLGIRNIDYRVEDCRRLSFKNGSFDRVVSISTIEHIAPDVGGDLTALKEIHRVLKAGTEFVMSVPFRERPSLVYDDVNAVWEKAAQPHNFYMRNYDDAQLERLAREAGFRITVKTPMFERPGLFAMEHWEGAGRSHPRKDLVLKLKKKIDKAIGLRLENILSEVYIHTGDRTPSNDRLMNVVTTLAKA